MRTKTFFLIILTVFFSEFSYSQIEILQKNIKIDTVRFAPEYVLGGEVGELTSNLEYIPLNTEKKPVISKIEDVAFTKNRVVVLDYENGLFIFSSKDGKLINCILGVPINGKKSSIIRFTIFEDQINLLSSLTESGKSITYLSKVDLDGKIKSTSIKTQINSINDSLKIKDDVYYFNQIGDKFGNKTLLTLNNRDLIKISDSSQVNWMLLNRVYPFSKNLNKDKHSYFSIWCDYRIFELSETGIDKITQFILPIENTIEYSKVISFKNLDEFEKNNEKNYLISQGLDNIQPYGERLLFYYLGNPSKNIIYNAQEQSFLSLNNILPDKSNNFLPIIGEFGHEYFYSCGEYLYSFLYPNQINSTIEKLKKDGNNVSKQVIGLSKHNNPILVKFKLK